MPRKIKVPKVVFHFEPSPEGEAGFQGAYNRIFDLARQELIKEREEKKQESDGKANIQKTSPD